MSEINETMEQGEEAGSEQTLGVELSPGDELMYSELIDEFGEEMISADVQEVVKERVRQLYDNRDTVAQQLQQAQQQAALGGR